MYLDSTRAEGSYVHRPGYRNTVRHLFFLPVRDIQGKVEEIVDLSDSELSGMVRFVAPLNHQTALNKMVVG